MDMVGISVGQISVEYNEIADVTSGIKSNANMCHHALNNIGINNNLNNSKWKLNNEKYRIPRNKHFKF